MAKGAAKEQQLGKLHAKITEIFLKVLDKYHKQLDFIDGIDAGDIENEMIAELLSEGSMPNPAMLSAITKFLKDNDIGFDTEKLSELSDQERRLKERREKRGNLVSLSDLKPKAEVVNG
jgi:hypothetical protein